MAMPPKFTKTFTNWDSLPLLLDLEDACDLLRCSDVTVKKFVKQGKIKGNKLGNLWRFDRDSIRDYFQNTGS